MISPPTKMGALRYRDGASTPWPPDVSALRIGCVMGLNPLEE